jgi:hypothetical protein
MASSYLDGRILTALKKLVTEDTAPEIEHG